MKSRKQQIALFKKLLLEKNKKLNLFSRKNPLLQLELLIHQAEISGKLFKDFFKENKGEVLDIGSGNGFPGLFFAILYPENKFFLCEQRRKKAEFLKQVIFLAKIKNAKVLCQKAESLSRPYPTILSQAAGSPEKMLKILSKTLAPKGRAFFWQSPGWQSHWPKNPLFVSQLFSSYQMEKQTKQIVQVSKKLHAE